MAVQDYVDRYTRLETKASGLKELKEAKTKKVKALIKYEADLTEASYVLSEVALLTQQQFKNKIEKLITLAMRAVYDSAFEFILQFKKKKDKTMECFPIVLENGEEFSPKDDDGGGLLDIIGIGARLVLLSLEKPRSRLLLVLDEPFKWTGTLISRAGAFLRTVSEGMGIQIIMISHDNALIDIGDKTWEVIESGKNSEVKLIKGSDDNGNSQ